MKYFLLNLVGERFSTFKSIKKIKRVDDNILKLEFDRDNIYYISLQRGKSSIFIASNFTQTKSYQAPFDIALQKYFSNSELTEVEVLKNNRILVLTSLSKQSYKINKIKLQLEFTGKNTNAIILNSQDIVIDALRYISSFSSFREVRPSKELLPLPEVEIGEKIFEVDDIDYYLKEEYKRGLEDELGIAKEEAKRSLLKRQKTLLISLGKLQNQDELLKESLELQKNSTLLLSNIHTLNSFDKKIRIKNFENQDVEIEIPQSARDLKEGINMLFQRSKKLKQKAKNLHIERENLEEKICFLNRLIFSVQNSSELSELRIYTKKRQKREKKENKESYFTLFLDGYKISVGRNQKENIALLKEAKAQDIWMHIKDRSGSHLIIHTGKESVREELLQKAAKICTNFSGYEGERCSVDYTKRKFVKIYDGACVNYDKYQTIVVDKRR